MSLVSFDVGFSQEGNEEEASDAIFIIRLAIQNITNISCITNTFTVCWFVASFIKLFKWQKIVTINDYLLYCWIIH